MFKRLSELDEPTVTVNIEGEDVRVPLGETVAATNRLPCRRWVRSENAPRQGSQPLLESGL